jgi:hypothetical protein
VSLVYFNYKCLIYIKISINAVQNRAMRLFMGVGKYTPNDAIAGDMGWKPAYIRQHFK